jgi:Mrp family chromosome partitioning ATPase
MAAGSLLDFVQQPETSRFFGNLHDNLFVQWHAQETRVVLVCAATPGEGASTVALGLALAAARNKQERILLVDGNPHEPCLWQLWQAKNNSTLTDYFRGQTPLEMIIQQTSIENLQLMAVGQDFGSQTQIVVTGQLQETLTKLTESFSRLIIDGPAINSYPESPLYAHCAQSILLVVAAGRSRAPVVLSALAKFPGTLRERLAVVLNRRIYPIPKFLYERLWSY